MQNVNATVKGNILTITVDLAAPTSLSASGKTEVIGTTRGNARITGPNGEVFLGLNVYQYPKAATQSKPGRPVAITQ